MENEAAHFAPQETEKQKVYAREEWFKAYVEGNARIPQTGAGMKTFLLAEIMQEGGVDWGQFFASQLAPNQLQLLGRIMSNLHKAHGVSHHTKENAHKFSEQEQVPYNVISESRLQDIWDVAKYEVFGAIARYDLEITNQFPDWLTENPYKINKLDIVQIQQIFEDPSPDWKLFRELSIAVAQELSQPEAKEILAQYIGSFKQSLPSQTGEPPESRWFGYRKRMIELITTSMMRQFPNAEEKAVKEVVTFLLR